MDVVKRLPLEVKLEITAGDTTWDCLIPLEDFYTDAHSILMARLAPAAAMLLDQVTDGERAKRDLAKITGR